MVDSGQARDSGLMWDVYVWDGGRYFTDGPVSSRELVDFCQAIGDEVPLVIVRAGGGLPEHSAISTEAPPGND